MKRAVILFSLLFYPLAFCRADYGIPENIYNGYGYVAGVDSINAAVVNPANLYLLNREEVSFILVKPLDFYSFLFGVPVFKNFYVGLGLLSLSPELQQFRAGFSLLNSEYIKLGIATGIDREREPGASDRVGFAFSPGATLLILSAPDVNFNLIFGAHYNNLITINNFRVTTNFSRSALDLGLRMELFIQNLFLNLGGDYSLSEFRTSVGLECLFFGFINIGAALLEENRINFGFTMCFENHYVGLALDRESYSLSYTFSLNNLAVHTSKQPRRQVRHEARVSQRILIKQRQLMEEGLTLYREKQYEKARTVWRRLVAMAPSTDYAREAKNYIDRVNSILKSIGE